MLRWLEPLEVAGLEPLGHALRLGQRATYSHVERLAGAGLVDRIYDRDGSLVAITLAGRRAARPDAFDGRPPRGGLVRGALSSHARAVSWVAARLSLRRRAWVSDREMRTLREWQVPVIWHRRGNHRPDLGVWNGSYRVAVEVELTAKSPRRLQAIFAGYDHLLRDGRLDGLIYVTDHAGVRRGVERAGSRAVLRSDQFRIWSLDDVLAETRRLAREPMAESAAADGGAR